MGKRSFSLKSYFHLLLRCLFQQIYFAGDVCTCRIGKVFLALVGLDPLLSLIVLEELIHGHFLNVGTWGWLRCLTWNLLLGFARGYDSFEVVCVSLLGRCQCISHALALSSKRELHNIVDAVKDETLQPWLEQA